MTPEQVLALGVELLELEVIAADVAAGRSIANASRLLHPWERRAQVWFADLDRIGEEAAGAIVRVLADVQGRASRALVADLAASGSTPALLARLNALLSPQSGVRLDLATVLKEAQVQVQVILAGVHRDAAAAVLAEAIRQGVDAAVLPDDRALALGTDDRLAMQESARYLVEQPVGRVLATAAATARTRAVAGVSVAQVVDQVALAVDALSDGPARDEARQAATRSANTGRAVAAAGGPEPVEIYASELLDGKTCRPCGDVDGRMYESLAAAMADYPGGGTYAGCEGGSRCRGTLVFVWGDESAPSLDNGLGEPGFPIDRTPRGPSLPDVGGQQAV